MDQYPLLRTTLMFYDEKWNEREEQLIVISHWFLLIKGARVVGNEVGDFF